MPYRGQCLVHRAELLQPHGAWPDALDEARRASTVLSQLRHRPWVGEAFYQEAELHRLRGTFGQAEEAYRQASQWGRDPQPGLAQLRLAQGQAAAAAAAIRRATDEARDSAIRARLLGPYVEIMLATDDLPAARAGAQELAAIAADLDAPYLRAAAALATGALLLREADAGAALAVLRPAWATWQELGAPYNAARVRVQLGLACRALGDEDGEAMELDAARKVFESLGAAVDVARLESLARGASRRTVGGLTCREVEVLRLVAAGQTNRQIALALGISGHTVRRHLQNVFARLGVPSRAAAAAFAVQHRLT
jgi:DNA-binding CsgD family transcriptional regulator